MDQENDLSPSLLWEWYNEVENRFIEYCKYVPLTEEHFDVWSVKLGSLIVEICSILDSFFKVGSFWLFSYPGFDSSTLMDEKKAIETDKTNIYIWKKVYDTFYGFSEKEINVIPLRKSIYPFRKWKNGGELEWWDAYNEVKHDRFRRLEKASFETALRALAGLFLAIAIHVPNKKYLYDTGTIEHIGLLDKFHYHCADMLLRKEPVMVYSRDYIIAKTSLFSYEYQKNQLQRNLSKARKVGGIPDWPSDNLWPECEGDCFYAECYRKQMEHSHQNTVKL